MKYEKSSPKHDTKKDMVINLNNGGGFGGVLILGGVLVSGVVASLLALKQRNHKPTFHKDNNPNISPSLHRVHSKEKDSKGLRFFVSDCCPKEHRHLSNPKTVGRLRKSSDVISTENLCKVDQNLATGCYGGEGGYINVDEKVFSCSDIQEQRINQCTTASINQVVTEDHHDLIADETMKIERKMIMVT